MKRFNRTIAFVLAGTLLLSACDKAQETDIETTTGEVSETTAASGNAETAETSSFNGSSGGSHSTGGLSEYGSGYEGIEGTGKYNYGEALQKSVLFYELQRSGKLPEQTRCNWRGDSGLTDGADNNIDLTGGWYDAGDNVKFNLPMAYSAAMLGWSVYEDRQAYEQSGQLEYMLGDIMWVCDYLIKCHPEDEVYYYQVGDGNADHSWWGPAEVMSMNRPSYCVTKNSPGSAVVGEAAAALAVSAIVFADTDKEYSKLCLDHAKSLYAFADSTRSDDGYTAANGFYNSWSGFYDELAWAGCWLYMATDDKTYLDNAKSCFTKAGHDYDWSLCWDDVHIGAAVLLAKITGEQTYKNEVQKHLDYWSCGTSDGQRITYSPKGLAWLDQWGSLRYATTTAYVATVYSRWDGCPSDKVKTYWDFAESQADYALGSSGRSYVVGFGENPPEHPHHRTSQGSYCDNMNEPGEARHTLYGALVGGPDASDGYTDTVSDYNKNEVACDYNAGFTGLMAAMYSKYHGQTLKDFGAVEEVPSDEYSAECSLNVQGNDFAEIKAFIYNRTAWPARCAENLEFRYFVDLSEIYQAGGDASGVSISTNYMQSGRCDGLKVWNEENHIYYLSVVFDDGALRPGGQSQYKSEIQVRMTSPNGAWDNGNDYSYNNAAGAVLLENGKVVFGELPDEEGSGSGSSAGGGSGNAQNTEQTAQTQSQTGNGGGQATSGDLTIKMNYNDMSLSANAIAGTIDITNTGSGTVDLSNLKINYYLTKEGTLAFDCYHAAVNSASGQYTPLTDKVKGTFESCTGEDRDTCLTITVGSGSLAKGDTLTISFSCHQTDWQNMDLSNDWSRKSVDNIEVTV
ncbi:glycoside hydrolase family 9 protein [Butyrivibrio sp. AE2032]|uniref:glycoside hydrolase family 9 protein n=1 Tax=Butyrivibrio sp. AE2032 TaxID=1458463 RepID=UPI00068B6BA7|nr:glycoside hydrolase family 9 protein [Butyrivibrio sp. AE2032]